MFFISVSNFLYPLQIRYCKLLLICQYMYFFQVHVSINWMLITFGKTIIVFASLCLSEQKEQFQK